MDQLIHESNPPPTILSGPQISSIEIIAVAISRPLPSAGVHLGLTQKRQHQKTNRYEESHRELLPRGGPLLDLSILQGFLVQALNLLKSNAVSKRRMSEMELSVTSIGNHTLSEMNLAELFPMTQFPLIFGG